MHTPQLQGCVSGIPQKSAHRTTCGNKADWLVVEYQFNHSSDLIVSLDFIDLQAVRHWNCRFSVKVRACVYGQSREARTIMQFHKMRRARTWPRTSLSCKARGRIRWSPVVGYSRPSIAQSRLAQSLVMRYAFVQSRPRESTTLLQLSELPGQSRG